jgi:hypothetical protein
VRLGLGRRGCLGSGRGAISVSGAIVITGIELRRLRRVRFICGNRSRCEILPSRFSSRSKVSRA